MKNSDVRIDQRPEHLTDNELMARLFEFLRKQTTWVDTTFLFKTCDNPTITYDRLEKLIHGEIKKGNLELEDPYGGTFRFRVKLPISCPQNQAISQTSNIQILDRSYQCENQQNKLQYMQRNCITVQNTVHLDGTPFSHPNIKVSANTQISIHKYPSEPALGSTHLQSNLPSRCSENFTQHHVGVNQISEQKVQGKSMLGAASQQHALPIQAHEELERKQTIHSCTDSTTKAPNSIEHHAHTPVFILEDAFRSKANVSPAGACASQGPLVVSKKTPTVKDGFILPSLEYLNSTKYMSFTQAPSTSVAIVSNSFCSKLEYVQVMNQNINAEYYQSVKEEFQRKGNQGSPFYSFSTKNHPIFGEQMIVREMDFTETSWSRHIVHVEGYSTLALVVSCKGVGISVKGFNGTFPQKGRVRTLGYVGSFLLQHQGIQSILTCGVSTEVLIQQILRPAETRLDDASLPGSFIPIHERVIDSISYPICPSQRKAVLGLRSGFEVIHGPPGTGKSTTIWHILNSCCSKTSKCLITCTRNQAVNAVVSKIASLGVLVFGSDERLGREAKMYTLQGRMRRDEEQLFWKKVKSAFSTYDSMLTKFIDSIFDILKRKIPFLCQLEKRIETEKIENGYSDDSDSDGYFEFFKSQYTPQRSAATLLNIALKHVMIENMVKKSKLNLWKKSFQKCTQKLNQISDAVARLRRNHILHATRIYLSTIDATPKMATVLEDENVEFKIDTCIVDEAGCVLECAIPMILKFGPTNLVLIGDHKQLQPFTSVWSASYECNHTRSLLERAVMNGFKPWFLSTQFRMHPMICSLVSSLFYGNRLETFSGIDRAATISSPCQWVNVSSSEIPHDGKGYSNPREAQEVCSTAKKLLKLSESVWVITFYNKQRSLILDLVKKDDALKKSSLEVSSIDACQGSEADYVILSPVRTDHIGEFMEDPRRLCVALSRAKYGCFIVGNKTKIDSHARGFWKQISKHYQTQ